MNKFCLICVILLIGIVNPLLVISLVLSILITIMLLELLLYNDKTIKDILEDTIYTDNETYGYIESFLIMAIVMFITVTVITFNIISKL